MAEKTRQWQKFDEEGITAHSNGNTESQAAARRDGVLLFVGRSVRMFSYGALTIVLLQYLEGLGMRDNAIGALLTVILLGDLGVSLWLTSRADNLGRRRCLLVGAVLKVFAGAAFSLVSPDYTWVLFPAGIIGVVSSTGGEIGPFLPIEQAALTQARSYAEPATLFAWYGAAGYLAQVPRRRTLPVRQAASIRAIRRPPALNPPPAPAEREQSLLPAISPRTTRAMHSLRRGMTR